MVSGEFGPLSVFDFTPLPAYVMAAVYSMLGPDPLYVRILNLILSAATCGIIFLIGKRLGELWVGLSSDMIFGLPPVVGVIARPMLFVGAMVVMGRRYPNALQR